MNILVLAAGQGPSPQIDGYPLCLAEFDSVPLIQRVIDSCRPLRPNQLIFAFRGEEITTYHLDYVVTLLWPDSMTLTVQDKTQGAACTALLATGVIESDDELLIVNGNELLDTDFLTILEDFRRRKLDAGVAVFHSIHPRYSYVRIDEDGLVIEAAEKKPISTNATVGFYWFAQGRDFVHAAKNMIRKDARVNGSFYICPTFNELVLEQRRIGIHQIDSKAYHPLKSGRQIDQFETAIERERNL
ncbi:MAG: glycosyltransferase family 2 protein [Methylococcaceae bacterium]